MDAQFVVIRYSRILPRPLAEAYEWLTDYRDDDPQRTGAVVTGRKVTRRDDGVILLDAEVVTLGQKGRGLAEVRTFPPDRWEARIVSGGTRGSVYEYRLVPLGARRTRLEVAYNVRIKRASRRLLVTLAKPLIRRELGKMWDGFAEAMERELDAAPTAKAP